MAVLTVILLIIAAICFGIAAFGPPIATRINFVALGLLAAILVPLLRAFFRMD